MKHWPASNTLIMSPKSFNVVPDIFMQVIGLVGILLAAAEISV
ncbi:hypothetical protein [Sphingomonas piscis]|nr:hypothetical protein [Sphingomonas piscis]